MHRTRQSIEAGILFPIKTIKYHTFFTGSMDRNRFMLSLAAQIVTLESQNMAFERIK